MGGWDASLARGPGQLRLVLGPVGVPVLELGAGELVSARAGGAELQLRAWATAAPQLRVQVAGSAARLARVREVATGATVQLLLETEAGEERVWAGPLREVTTPRPGQLELVIDDPTAWALVRHRGASGAWRDGLFVDSLEETTLAASFTPGAGTMQLTLTSSLAHVFAAEPGATRSCLLEVQDADGTYYVSARNESVGLMSGCEVVYQPAVATTSPSGTPVRLGPLFEGSPLDVLLRVLLSTGSGGGGYDLLAADQGLGVLASLVDTTDAARVSGPLNAVGYVDRYVFAALDAQTDPEGGALLAWCAALGVWPCLRQGSLTVRAAVDPHDGAAWAALYAGEVTDAELVAVGVHSTRAPDMVPEYLGGRALATTSAGLPSEPILLDPALGGRTTPRTWPAGPDTADLGWAGLGPVPPICVRAYTDGTPAYTEHIAAVQRRLCPWLSRQCEAVEVTLRGPALGWAMGDLVSVTSRSIPGPVADGGVAVGRRALWVPQSWDWVAREVQGVLYLLGTS